MARFTLWQGVRDESGERWETEVYQKGDRILFPSVELEVAIEELYRGMSWRS